MNIKSTKFLLENGTATLGGGSEPAQIYTLMGRNTRDILTNKTLTDPSNKISATQLQVGNSTVALNADGAVGTVLTRTTTGASFLPGGGGGNSPYDVVVVSFIGPFIQNGSLYYVNLSAPTDIIGTSAASVSIQASAFGQELVCTKQIDIIDTQIGLQYIIQGSAQRTFLNVDVGGVTRPSPGAATVSPGINNFRQTFNYMIYGVPANQPVKAVVNTNIIGPLTLNTGRFYLLIPA